MALLDLALLVCRRSPFERGLWRLQDYVMERIDRRNVVARSRDGFLMRLDTADFIQRTIYVTGRWDAGVAEAVRRHLSPGGLFVDIGANVGYFSLLAASRGARVVAFEPNPDCRAALIENAQLNGFGQVDVRAVALAEGPGRGTLTAEPHNVGAGRLHGGAGRPIEVVLDSLDSQLAGETPTLIKIDAEGAELRVLRGARSVLGRCGPPVIAEVSEWSLKQAGGSKDEMFELMADLGYRVEVISTVGRSNATTSSVYFQYDVLFIRS